MSNITNCTSGTLKTIFDDFSGNYTCQCKQYYTGDFCQLHWLNIEWFFYSFLIYRFIIIAIELFIQSWCVLKLYYIFKTNKIRNIVCCISIIIYFISFLRMTLFIIDPYSMYGIIDKVSQSFIIMIPIFFFLLTYNMLVILFINLTNLKLKPLNETKKYTLFLTIVSVFNILLLFISCIIFLVNRNIAIPLIYSFSAMLYLIIVIVYPVQLYRKYPTISTMIGNSKKTVKGGFFYLGICWIILVVGLVARILLILYLNETNRIYLFYPSKIIEMGVEITLLILMLNILCFNKGYIYLIKYLFCGLILENKSTIQVKIV